MSQDVVLEPGCQLISAPFNLILSPLSCQSAIAIIEDELREILDLQMLANSIDASKNFGISEAGARATSEIARDFTKIEVF